MIELVLDFLKDTMASIPIVNGWFSKSEMDQEKQGRLAVDLEQDQNAALKRPSGDFWKDKGL